MANSTIEIQGLTELQGRFAEYPRLQAKYVGQALAQSGTILLQFSQLASLATLPQDTGNLRSAFKWQTQGMTGTLYVDPDIAPYAVYVNQNPGDPDRTMPHWPPISALQGWADRHGIPVFLVARAISKRGTKRYPFMTNIAQQSTPSIIVAFRNAYEDLLAELAGSSSY